MERKGREKDVDDRREGGREKEGGERGRRRELREQVREQGPWSKGIFYAGGRFLMCFKLWSNGILKQRVKLVLGNTADLYLIVTRNMYVQWNHIGILSTERLSPLRGKNCSVNFCLCPTKCQCGSTVLVYCVSRFSAVFPKTNFTLCFRMSFDHNLKHMRNHPHKRFLSTMALVPLTSSTLPPSTPPLLPFCHLHLSLYGGVHYSECPSLEFNCSATFHNTSKS